MTTSMASGTQLWLGICLAGLSLATSVEAQFGAGYDLVDATAQALQQMRLDDAPTEKAIEIGDYDRDGDPDVVVAITGPPFGHPGIDAPLIGPRPNRLYRNDDGVLVDVTAEVIPGFLIADTSRAAFLRDVDQDDWLDLIVVNDSILAGIAGTTRLYVNREVDGQRVFIEETERLGGAGGPACGATAADWNGDGIADLYVGNYPFPAQDTLYFNDGTGLFGDATEGRVPTDDQYTVDNATADLDGDQAQDLIVANHFSASYVYWNRPGPGGQLGDFDQTPPTVLTATSLRKPAFEPADFDRDGRVDLYASNHQGERDRALRNAGLDGGGAPILVPFDLPIEVSLQDSRKARIGDVDDDRRPEVVVMSESGRPSLLRNVSASSALAPGAELSFLDWTPASAFPLDAPKSGWEAAFLDVDRDGVQDLFVGGHESDHLLLGRTPDPLTEEEAMAAPLDLVDGAPVTILAAAATGERDTYRIDGFAGVEAISVLLRGCGDLALEVRDAGEGELLARSDRRGVGVDEALWLIPPAGPLTVEVVGVGGGSCPAPLAESYELALLARTELCLPGDGVLCLGDRRFSLSVEWQDFAGSSGSGRAVPLTADTGAFWFFGEDNLELLVKVLDGRGVNGSFWVFAAALTNAGYTLRVVDHLERSVSSYSNPPGRFRSFADIDFSVGAIDLGRAPLAPGTPFRARHGADGVAPSSPRLVPLREDSRVEAGKAAVSSSTSGCVTDRDRLCLGARFEVSVEWLRADGATLPATSAPLTGDSGAFWFLGPDNLELVVKVLDGRSINDRFWVFYGGLSNLEYEIRVVDTRTGAEKSYQNPRGVLASAADIEAF